MAALKLHPELVVKNGQPQAVILQMADYEELLERLEDADDLRWLRAARSRKLHFRKLDEYLAEAASHVPVVVRVRIHTGVHACAAMST